MKLALIGYGKMGKAIEGIALERGHEISLRADREGFEANDLKSSDVAIEFTTPDSAEANIKKCVDADVPVVVGTTAWYDSFNSVSEYVKANNGGLFTATNFSIGVNLFWKLIEFSGQLMSDYTDYEASIDEIHHTEKLDAPSGTAITTAERLLLTIGRKKDWIHHENGDGSQPTELEMIVRSFREQGVPGTHTVKFDSSIDSIEIKHTAHSRIGFASGALTAAEWMKGKSGIYTMKDLLNI